MGQVYIYGFDASPNVRDLGGYETENGRVVKYNKIIRGVSVGSFISDHDIKLFNYFKFKTVMDFRSHSEVLENPDPEIEGVNLIVNPAMRLKDGEEIDFSPDGMDRLAKVFKDQGFNGQEWFDYYYRQMLYNKLTYGEMFKVLLKEEVPLYIHCAAGKDRTGVGAILTLLALGVSREDAIEEYLLTNHCLKDAIDRKLEERRSDIEKYPELEFEIRKMYGVDATALNDELDKIYEKYGSYREYLKEVFELTEEDLNRLQELYTEKLEEVE